MKACNLCLTMMNACGLCFHNIIYFNGHILAVFYLKIAPIVLIERKNSFKMQHH